MLVLTRKTDIASLDLVFSSELRYEMRMRKDISCRYEFTKNHRYSSIVLYKCNQLKNEDQKTLILFL